MDNTEIFQKIQNLEAKIDQYPGQLLRSCVELAKDWRTDRYLRRLEAMMLVADDKVGLVLTGTGDVLEPEQTEHGAVMAIGSGGNYALAAARALLPTDQDAETIVRAAMKNKNREGIDLDARAVGVANAAGLRARVGTFAPISDQQKRGKARELPEHEQRQDVVAEDDPEHRSHEREQRRRRRRGRH